MKKIIIFLTFAWLALYCQQIVILKGNTPVQKRYAAALEKGLKKIGLEYGIAGEKSLNEDELKEASLLILPCNGPFDSSTSERIRKFSLRGGKLFAFYSEDKTIIELLGIKSVKYKSGLNTEYAEISNRTTLFSAFPGQVEYSAGSIMVPTVNNSTVILGRWKDEKGKDSGIPAVTWNRNGIYFSKVYPLHAGESMLDFLACGIAMTVPGTLEKYCSRIKDESWAFKLNTLERRIAAAGRTNFYSALANCRKLLAEADALYMAGKYGDALSSCRKADSAAREIYISTASSRPAEMRGVWCHSAYGISGMTWDEIAELLAANGFNALFVNACWADYADYESKVLEVAPSVKNKGDQIKQCLEACRKHGLQLHIWRVCWNLGHRYPQEKLKQMQKAGRTQISRTGDDSSFLAPHQKENLNHELEAIREIAGKYPVDGIHLDYIRYSSSRFDYSDGARKEFEKYIGRNVAKWPEDCSAGGIDFQKFCNWRCNNISALVEGASREIKKINPAMKLSVAVYPEWNNSPEWIGQDVRSWIDNKWVDFICPMNYSNDMKRYIMWLNAQNKYVSGRIPVYSGIALYMLGQEPLEALLQAEEAARRGFDGYVCFDLKKAFMEKCMPSFGRALNKCRATVMPHNSPALNFNAIPGDEDIDGRYRVNAVIKAAAELPEQLWNSSTGVSVEINGRDMGGKGVSARYSDRGIEIFLNTFEPGEYRIRIENGTFMARSRTFSVLSDEDAREVVLRKGPPVFKNNGGIRVAVWDDGSFGAAPVINALESNPEYDVAVLHNTKEENLKDCQVIILPQMRNSEEHFKNESTADIFRKYVRQGGGLLVTHALVGIRSYPVHFKDIVKSVNQVALQENMWHISENGILKGLPTGNNASSARDMIEMIPGRKGRKLTLSASGKCTSIAGKMKKGKFVACGLGLGIDKNDNDTPLTETEKKLLYRMVDWLAE